MKESSPEEEKAKGDLDATVAADGSGETSGKPATPVETSDTDGDDEEVDPLELLRAFKEGDPDAELPENLTEKAGDEVGPYKLLQQIGEGGFGVVWMAEQREPISRNVALKVIKAGMDTKEVLARFEAERQAVALMDHTHIAKVLDAGATKSGRPWFAMELVKGVPITQFCDEEKLGTRERLELFGDVCSAINHAHQKGVIHRDIKPSNVLVTRDGDKPVVKVIDFGIAKATQGRLTDKTLFTAFEQMIGTPVYMSPEQAGLGRLDIDTRSDIYSLGVLLYELLTGRPPFDGKSLISAGYEEMRRIIREEEPPRPSLKLSTMSGDGDETTRITSTHGVEPQKLSRLVRGDLDWIVMKAIEKDRSRRYETANAFAADIGRYLDDEPVEAAAPSAAYRFRKFARRNKAAIGTAALITAVLIVATGVSTWQAIEAQRARVQSDKDKEDAEAISSYLVEVFQSPDPARDGRTITVAESLDAAVKKLETDLADQPGRKAQLQLTLAQTYRALGLNQKALPLSEKVRDYCVATLGAQHPNTLVAMGNLANSYRDANRLDEAIPLQEEVLALSREVIGPGHPNTLLAMINLAASYNDTGRLDEAIPMQVEVLALSREVNGPEHPNTLMAMGNLAKSYVDAGRREEALEMTEEVLAFSRKVNGPGHPNTIHAMYNLAIGYREVGRRGEALEIMKEALALSREVNGPEHPVTLWAMRGIGDVQYQEGEKKEAIESFRRAIELDPNNAKAQFNLGSALKQQGEMEEAIAFFQRAIELDPEFVEAHYNLGNAWIKQGEMEEAIASFRRAIESDPEHAGAHANLGNALNQQGETREAIELLRRAIELDPENGKVHNMLGSAWGQLGKTEEEIASFRRAIELEPEYAEAHYNLGNTLNQLGRTREAIDSYRRAIELDPEDAQAHNNLGLALFQQGAAAEAIALYHRAIEIDPGMVSPHFNLGGAMLQQGKTEEAIAYYQQVIELDPEYAEAHNNLGVIWGQQGKTEEAIASCRRAIEVDPKYAEGHSNLGWFLQAQGKWQQAIPSFLHAIELDPQHLNSYGSLALAYGKSGKIDRGGIWLVRMVLAQGETNEQAIIQGIPSLFPQLGLQFPTEEATEEVIQEYYDAHPDSFSDTAMHVRMISVPKPGKTREFMETLRRELIDGGDFAAAAQEHSDDSAASKGGDRGWVKRGFVQADLDKAAFALKPGEFSEVIEDDSHFRILNVVERKEGEIPPLSEVREKVIVAIEEVAQTARIQGWIEEAKRELAAERKARGEEQN